MKIRLIILTFGALLFCFSILPTKALAQTSSGYTSIDYDENTNIVDAYSETTQDYDVTSAYQAFVKLSVIDDNASSMGVDSAVDNGNSGFVSVEIQFYGSPGTTYTAIGLHKAYTNNWDYNYLYWPLVTLDYYDFYNFGFFENQGIVDPFSHSWLGPGPSATRPTAPILLGSTTDEASVTVAGPPHHVRVVKDDAGRACGTGLMVRLIEVQIVDQSGDKITTTASVAESFSNVSNNSCGNGPPQPASCAPAQRGKWIDGMSVTEDPCNPSNAGFFDSGCGYTLTSTWSICSGSSNPAIWRYNGETRSNLVLVNGGPHYNKNTYLFP